MYCIMAKKSKSSYKKTRFMTKSRSTKRRGTKRRGIKPITSKERTINKFMNFLFSKSKSTKKRKQRGG